MKALAVLLTLSVCACATSTPRLTCLPMRTYSEGEQKALASALSPLPADSIIIVFVGDYLAMREANRACKGIK